MKQLSIILTTLLLFFTTSVTYAQPDLPKSEISKEFEREIRLLIRELYSERPGERGEAAYVLGNMGARAKDAVPFFLAMLDDDDYVSMYSLIGVKGASTPALLAIEALGKIRDERAIDPLVFIMRGERYQEGVTVMQKVSAAALESIGGDRTVKLLLEIVQDKNSEIKLRSLAARVLGRIKDKSIVEPLIKMLKDEDPVIKGIVARLLGELGDERAVKPLTYALEDMNPEKDYINPIVLALNTFGWEPKDASIKNIYHIIFEDKDELKKNGEPAVDALIIILKNERQSDKTRIFAIDMLAELGSERAVEPLIKTLKDRKPHIVKKSIEALGIIKDHRAIKPLISMLDNDDEKTRKLIAEVLKLITGEDFGDTKEIWLRWYEENKGK